jgi:glycosyltransferase involved in cell wall biosynthesis
MLSSGNLSWRGKTTVNASGDGRLLKILHIDPERHWGGGEAQVLGLLEYLSVRGHRNDLLTHPDGRLFQQSQKLGIKILPLVVRNDLDLRSIPKLRRLMRAENYDIVHLHTKRAHALSLWLPRGSAGPKYVVTRRMDYPETNHWYTRHLYNQRVDGVVAISEKILQLLIEGGVARQKIRLIHSGIDPQPFESVGDHGRPSSERAVVGVAAVLEKRKGHRFLLEAAGRLKRQGCQLKYCFAGEGSLRRSLEETASRLGLQEDVQFLGFVADIPRFLAAVDIVVLPSLFEGLGVSVLEAMAAGKAVIASRVGGLPELVIDAVTGFLVAPQDIEGLMNAIGKLAGNSSLTRQMGRKGRERLKSNFTLEQMGRKNEAYYYDLLGPGNGSDGVME